MNPIKSNIRLIVLAVLTGMAIGWVLFSEDKQETNQTYPYEIPANKQVWTCSMHPQIRRNEPGQCPLCSMDLIPVQAQEEGVNSPLKMTAAAMKLANIQTTKLKKKIPQKEMLLNGKIQIDERSILSQTGHIAGRIEKLAVNFTGEQVRKGQLLANIYAPDLVNAQEELLTALQMQEQNPEILAAARQKLKFWKLTDEQIDKIEKSRKVTNDFPLTADVTGIVINLKVAPGDHIHQGQILFQVADLNKLWVLFDAYESDVAWIKKGDRITYQVSAYPGKEFQDSVSYIDPVIDPKTRVAKVRVEVKNRARLLKPEMFVQGKIVVQRAFKKPVLTVPKSAVMWTGKRSVAYVKVPHKHIAFEMRQINLGVSLGDYYVVASGLKVGDEVVTNGTFTVDAAAQLNSKYSMMNQNKSLQTTDEHVKKYSSHKLTKAFRQQMAQAIQIYLQLKGALVDSDSLKAKLAASQLRKLAAKMIFHLPEETTRDAWVKTADQIQTTARKMSNATKLEQQREYFTWLSDNMIHSIKTFGSPKDLYIQHCPMANDFSGAYWLSDSDEILNPYFGESMLHCGEVREKFNKK